MEHETISNVLLEVLYIAYSVHTDNNKFISIIVSNAFHIRHSGNVYEYVIYIDALERLRITAFAVRLQTFTFIQLKIVGGSRR